MAAVPLFRDTNMAAVTSREKLSISIISKFLDCEDKKFYFLEN